MNSLQWFQSLSEREQQAVLAAARIGLQDGELVNEVNASYIVAHRLVEQMDANNLGQPLVQALI